MLSDEQIYFGFATFASWNSSAFARYIAQKRGKLGIFPFINIVWGTELNHRYMS